jgi:ElaB/YqjD/DUF883 family membrane-anchored ribosome-binding protein
MTPADTAGREPSERPVAEPIREVLASLGNAAREKGRELAAASGVKLDEIKKKSLEDLYNDTRTYIRENPGKTVLGALAAGFILGRLLRRR